MLEAPAPAVPAPTAAGGDTNSAPLLFDYFLNVPHPAASKSTPPMSMITAPHITQPDSQLVSQIQAFCFPEYEETSGPATVPGQAPQRSTAAYQAMVLNKFDMYCMQPKSFSSFTFTLQLQDGRRLYGHVRRSLPLHEKAPTRYDVGRRGERALVLLTQTAGAGQLYQAILKSVDAIASLQKALLPELRKSEEPEKQFLHAIYKEQQRVAAHYQQRPTEERGKPLIAALSGLEVQQSPLFANQDINRFMIPTCLLHNPYVATEDGSAAANADKKNHLPTGDSTSSVLPLLRCVGVAHALRILAALLSERRVILTSSSPTRLSTCSHAALAMLHCGLLHWQHLYIPVLPPHLWQYLAAPYPYLIGILHTAVHKLDHTDGLGEVLLVNLDSNSMETRNIPQQVVAQRLPDLFSAADPNYYNESGASNSSSTNSPHAHRRHDKDPPSASEFLAQDLLDILKTDKKTLYGEGSALTNVGETAGKAAKAIKSGFSKLKKKLKGKDHSEHGHHHEEEEEETHKSDDGMGNEANTAADDYIFTEGCHNEVGEQEARLAFTCFFLALIGNMRWYVTQPAQGELPQLDRNRFLEQKRKAGDGQGSALWPLLQNFTQTQMFEEHVKARVEEIRSRVVVSTPDAPLFAQCSQYHRQHNIDFAITSVRRVSRQVAQANPGRLTGLLQTNARRMAMSLTSNKAFEGDAGRAIAQLVEQCRESSSVLFDVMSVIWLRLRDSRGMQWKHGYQAMSILKNLLYHGPLAAVAEATDGLDKIRAIKYYDHMRGGVAQDMRTSAQSLFNLLVDRSKLWAVRRLCAKKRRDMTIPPAKKPKLEKMTRIKPTDAIEQIHGAFHPMARATIVQMPADNTQQPPGAVPAALLSSTGPVPTPTSADDLFGLGAPAPVPAATASINEDLMGLFGGMSTEDASASLAAPASGELASSLTTSVAAPASEELTSSLTTSVTAPAPEELAPAFAAQPTIAAIPPAPAVPTPPASGGAPAATAPQPAQPASQYYGGAPPPPPAQLQSSQQWPQAPVPPAATPQQPHYGGAAPSPQQSYQAQPQYQQQQFYAQPQAPGQQPPPQGYYQSQVQAGQPQYGYAPQQPQQPSQPQQPGQPQQPPGQQTANPFAAAPAPPPGPRTNSSQFDPFASL